MNSIVRRRFIQPAFVLHTFLNQLKQRCSKALGPERASQDVKSKANAIADLLKDCQLLRIRSVRRILQRSILNMVGPRLPNEPTRSVGWGT